MLVDNDCDGAVLDAGRNRLEAGGRDALDDLFRNRSGGNVDFRDRHAEQFVAHRATDDACLLAIAIKYAEQTRQRASRKPGDIVQLSIGAASRQGHYFVVPGTNLPFSMCAGT